MVETSLFKNIPISDLASLIRSLNGRTTVFKKDMTILSNLNNINEIGIILNGKASIIRIDYNGNRTIVTGLVKNDIFGGCFSDYMNEEMSVVADEETEVLFIDYDKILGKNSAYRVTLIENMLGILMKKVNAYNRRIEVLNQRSIRDKLLEFFHILEKEQTSSSIKLPFNYTVLADYLAVDRSAMMREIKNLKEEQIIKVDKQTVKIIYR